ncbi:hypothetical protein ACEWY4_001347 [Coilia grayii]|uniref:Uncharacterized protein n=1 Tax=Coilia grayii TaxID=363190 RepID=A0ABD1KSN5_9TELE
MDKVLEMRQKYGKRPDGGNNNSQQKQWKGKMAKASEHLKAIDAELKKIRPNFANIEWRMERTLHTRTSAYKTSSASEFFQQFPFLKHSRLDLHSPLSMFLEDTAEKIVGASKGPLKTAMLPADLVTSTCVRKNAAVLLLPTVMKENPKYLFCINEEPLAPTPTVLMRCENSPLTPDMVSIKMDGEYWPYLFTQKGIYNHFQHLTDISILEKMGGAMAEKGKITLQSFRKKPTNSEVKQGLSMFEADMSRRRAKVSHPSGNINLTTTQVNSSPNREDPPAPTAVNEIAILKIKLEAEKEKGNLRDETISILKADKVYLQDELAKKDAFIRSALTKMKPAKKPAFTVSTSEDTAREDAASSSLSDSSAEDTKVKGKHRPKKKRPMKSTESSEQPSGSGLVHSRVRMRNTKGIILRYVAALEAFKKGHSMKAAFAAVEVDRNTVSRTAIIAELHLAAPEVFGNLKWNERTETLSAFIERCRATLSPAILEKINQMKVDGELLPMAPH